MEQDDLTLEEQEVSPMWEFLREEYDYRELQRGEIRTGVVLSKSDEQIVVDIGAKREGIVPEYDLQRLDSEDLAAIAIGDEVPVYIVRPQSRDGEIIVSINLARTMRDWQRARELMDKGEIFEAQVVGYNKGGVVVNFGQLQGFVPRSHLMHLDSRALGSTSQEQLGKLVDQTIPLKVIEVNRRQRRLIMSERVAWREWRRRQKERLLLELREGDIRRGRVSSLADFGVFVDLGGADGLIHLSELSWDRNARPRDVVEVGQEIDVCVLNVDQQRRRIGLSLKRLQPDPWTLVEIKYQPGDIVQGTVTNVAKFGAFARLEPGVEGLVHLSELADGPVSNPRDLVNPGEEYMLRVLDVDGIRRRIALSLRQAPQPEPALEPEMFEPELEPEVAEAELELELEALEPQAAVEPELDLEAPEPEAAVELELELEAPEPEVEPELELEAPEPEVELDLELEALEPEPAPEAQPEDTFASLSAGLEVEPGPEVQAEEPGLEYPEEAEPSAQRELAVEQEPVLAVAATVGETMQAEAGDSATEV